ncbi:MAG: efflux RND transporter periplasmic adaptor subunit [Oscillospiraceae bacterium]|nr:efflux RND transporter periplasmic adaptor subunit [Oscillospiraceae bacterium]
MAQLKSESQQRIADLTLQLKMAQLEYEQLEYELSNGVIYATVAGTVKTVRDPDEALAESSPVVLISGGGGYYVTGVLGEFDLDTMAVGDTVTVYSWQSGEQIEGTITEISEYPTESDEYYYYTDGNANISKYPFTVMVDEDANLREGEYVYIYIANSGWDDDGSVYLYNPFLRTEGGKSYIWVAAEDGTLEKRYVTTGMSIWGSYTQITSGLTEGDYVAFPYSKSLREGAKVKYNEDTDSLYGY